MLRMPGNEKDSDAELVYKMRGGDENAFNELYSRYARTIYGYIASRMDDPRDVEEMVQDTFRNAWHNIATLEDPERVLNWMFRIAYQCVIGRHRKDKKHRDLEFGLDVSDTEAEPPASTIDYNTPEDAVIASEQLEAVHEAIAQLPPKDLQVIHLQMEWKSYEEIAEITGATESSVKNKLSRAKKKLKVLVEAIAEDQGLDISEFLDLLSRR